MTRNHHPLALTPLRVGLLAALLAAPVAAKPPVYATPAETAFVDALLAIRKGANVNVFTARCMPQCRKTRPGSARLVRGSGLDGQRVDVGLHHLAQGGIDRAVAGQRRLAGEHRADDPYGEMATPIAGTLVPGMLVAVVHHLQRDRLQGLLQRRADALDPGHGRTLRNGRTSTRA